MKLWSIPRAAILVAFGSLAAGTFAIIGCTDKTKMELDNAIKEIQVVNERVKLKGIVVEKLYEKLTELEKEGVKGANEKAAAKKQAEDLRNVIVALERDAKDAKNDNKKLQDAADAANKLLKEKDPKIEITVTLAKPNETPDEIVSHTPPELPVPGPGVPSGGTGSGTGGTEPEAGGDKGKKLAAVAAAAAAVAAGTPVGWVAIGLAILLDIDIDLGLLTKEGNPIENVIKRGIEQGKLPKDFKWPDKLKPNSSPKEIEEAINTELEKFAGNVKEQVKEGKEDAQKKLEQVVANFKKDTNEFNEQLRDFKNKPATEWHNFVLEFTKNQIKQKTGVPSEQWPAIILEVVRNSPADFLEKDIKDLEPQLKDLAKSPEPK